MNVLMPELGTMLESVEDLLELPALSAETCSGESAHTFAPEFQQALDRFAKDQGSGDARDADASAPESEGPPLVEIAGLMWGHAVPSTDALHSSSPHSESPREGRDVAGPLGGKPEPEANEQAREGPLAGIDPQMSSGETTSDESRSGPSDVPVPSTPAIAEAPLCAPSGGATFIERSSPVNPATELPTFSSVAEVAPVDFSDVEASILEMDDQRAELVLGEGGDEIRMTITRTEAGLRVFAETANPLAAAELVRHQATLRSALELQGLSLLELEAATVGPDGREQSSSPDEEEPKALATSRQVRRRASAYWRRRIVA